jgi:hypothetical protein
MIAWRAFMRACFPDGNPIDSATVFGYFQAPTLVQVLKQCGDKLSRENVMKQAASLKDYDSGVSLPGSGSLPARAISRQSRYFNRRVSTARPRYRSARRSATSHEAVAQVGNPTAIATVRTKTGSMAAGLGKTKPISIDGPVIDSTPFGAWKGST